MAQPGFFSPRQRGFTLVEIVVVIAIMGLLLIMLIGISSAIVGNQRRADTKNKLANVETALALFVSQNRRLPCPADGSFASDNADAGREWITGSGPNIQCNLGGAGGQIRGVVPWRALGLSEPDATDGWGTRLTYRVHANFARQGSMNLTFCDPGGTDTAVTFAIPAVPDATSGYCNPLCTTPFVAGSCTAPERVTAGRGIEVRNVAGAPVMNPLASPSTGAAYVLVSHGENRAGGYDSSGVVQAASGPSSGTEEAKNAANLAYVAGTTYFLDDFPVYVEGTGHFDDFVIRPSILAVATKANLGPRAH